MTPTPQTPRWSPDLAQLLHFDQVLADIADLTVTPPARERVLALWPVDNGELREGMLADTGELQQLLEGSSPPPLTPFDDLRPDLAGREKGGAHLSAEKFGALRVILRMGVRLQKYFHGHAEPVRWRQHAALLQPWAKGPQAISRIIDDDCSIKDSASAGLGHIRTSIRRKEKQARSALAAIHKGAMAKGWGQDEPIAWRDGRLVIAFKASHKRKVKGLIHGYSGSGSTAFVEPLEVFDLNNEIAGLLEEEQAEIDRLLSELTDELRPLIGAVTACIEILYRLDLHLAIARWADDAHAVRPSFSAKGDLHLLQAVNPLLSRKRVAVPLDLALSATERVLLISGPNTGGKTVVLLTVGLLCMLGHSGLPVPAKAALLPELTSLYADLGDHQSLEHDLSTFSAHLLNLQSIVSACGPGSLVLLDELGTGTEPDSGAALGQAFLETIRQKGALCLVTSHLNRLKAWAQEEEGILSGAMTFDPKRLAPTYILQLHQPGASYALEIAQRLGLDRTILARARELIPEAALELEELLVTLQAQKGQLQEKEATLTAEAAHAARREEQFQRKEDQILAAHKRAEKDALAEARQLVAGINKRLEGVVSEIRTKGGDLTGDDIRRAKGAIAAMRDELDQRAEQVDRALTATPQPQKLAIGSWVELLSQGRRGQVQKLSRNGQKVTVEIDGTRITVAADQLALANPPEDAESQPATQAQTGVVSAARHQLDVRGERGDAAVMEMERFLDQAILGGLREVEIIHGKGTGILQKLLHERLQDHPQVAAFKFADFDAGGTGATLIRLK